MKPILPDKVYDFLVILAQYIVPAIGTFYGALVGIWGFPYGEQILATLMAFDTALGALLGVSLKNWKQNKIPEQGSTEPNEEVPDDE